MSNAFVDRTGEVYGRWTIKSYSHSTSAGRHWLCVCTCGRERAVFWGALQTGASKSCGICVKEENGLFTKTHGRSKTRLYKVWKVMRERCHNPESKGYSNYGARGITVCQEWRDSFEAFFRDMGEKPGNGYSLERLDNNSGYRPGNVCWASAKVQGRNKRTTHMLTFNGETKSMIEWSELLGIDYSTLRNRVNTYGWSDEKALSTPTGEAPPPTEGDSKRVFIDHTGEVHGDWTILKYSHFAVNNGRAWLCRCACGLEKAVYYSQLKSGKSLRCGSCSSKKRMAKRYGHAQTA